MKFLEYFKRSPKSATLAKDRLSIIVARERVGARTGVDYLPQLQQELLAVLAKYETIDLQNVSVKLDKTGECDVLELNIVLPDAVINTVKRPGKAALATYEEPRLFIPAVRAIVLCYVTATSLFAASLLIPRI